MIYLGRICHTSTVQNIGHQKSFLDDYHDHEVKRDSFPLPPIDFPIALIIS